MSHFPQRALDSFDVKDLRLLHKIARKKIQNQFRKARYFQASLQALQIHQLVYLKCAQCLSMAPPQGFDDSS